jgi:hypothetical protein
MLLLIAFPVLLETSVCFFACYREIGSGMIMFRVFGFLFFGFVVARRHVEHGRSQSKSRQK